MKLQAAQQLEITQKKRKRERIVLQSKNAAGKQALHTNASKTVRNSLKPALVILGLLIASVARAADTAGATQGEFTVTPTGASNYRIPIVVPPGIAGMAPKLELVYNSQGGNGLLGMGWGISGLSAITRCPNTYVRDGVKKGISYTSTDKYCLNGQRLVQVATPTISNPCTSSAEYRTERESFTRVVSCETDTTGPKYFKVWTKAGQIIEFGKTTDSSIEAQGKTAIRVWAANKISDSKGNYLTVSYTEDNTNGQYYPTRIDYTGNATSTPVLTPTNSVQFLYAARPDITPLYDSGSMIKTNVRLTNMQTHAKVGGADKLVKDYRFAYDPVITTTNRSRLISLTECDGEATATCLRPTTLGWQDIPNPGAYEKNTSTFVNTTTGDYGPWTGDFNGDGRADLLSFDFFGTRTFTINLSNANGGSSHQVINAASIPCAILSTFPLADFDGDGKTDILGGCLVAPYGQPSYLNLVVYFSNGDGTFTQKVPPLEGSNYNYNAGWLGDFNGDGRMDVRTYWAIPPLSGTFQGYFIDYFSNGDGTFTKIQTPAPNNFGAGYLAFPGDFNGDGKLDIMSQFVQLDLDYGELYPIVPEQYVILLSNGDGTYDQKVTTLPAGNSVAWVGDFNGDGKTDGLGVANNFVLYFSKGDGTFDTKESSTAHSAVWPNYMEPSGDFNGDGKTDVLSYPNLITLFSNGDGSFTQKTSTLIPGAGASKPVFGDFTGDGKTDFLVLDASGQYVFSPSNSVLDYLANLTTGLGLATSVSYKPLTDSTVYTKESSGVYPVKDIQFPMHVASQISSSNGIGGHYASNYIYVGGKAHLRGGGPLGFRQVKFTDAQTGLLSTTNYGQGRYGSDISCSGIAQVDSAYPYCLFDRGLSLSTEKRTASNGLLNQVINTWTFDAGGQYHVPKLTRSVESSYELATSGTGPFVSTITTDTQYDGFGNPTIVTTTSNDGYSKTSSNIYTNDTVNWYLGRLTKAVVTSTSPDTAPSAPPTSFTPVISVAAYSADKAEGNSGATPFTFTVARTSSTSSTSSVIWAVTGSGASPATAADFVGGVMPSGTASFSAGQTSQTLTINVQGNTALANDKEFKVTLSNPVNASLGTSVAAGTIQNDDTLTPPLISIAALSADKAEGNSGSTGFTYTVSRSGTVTPSSTAHWAVTGSSAAPANAADFTGSVLPSGQLTFAAGETTLTLNINVQGENDYEVDEGFTVTLSAPENATLGTSSATGIIRNDASDAYTFQEIAANTVDYNLRTKAIAAGWNQVAPLNANITVNGGVVISASSTATPAFTIDGSYPAGSIINLDNKAGAYIVGKGGAGANPNGLPGGLAMRIAPSAATVRITNNGVIGGGGGGGGYGGAGWKFSCDNGNVATGTQYGGGGAGYGPGPGAVGGLTTGGAGATLNGSVSGSGGGLGAAGGNGHANYCQYDDIHYGGAGGAATLGAANASWLVTGTRLGAVQ